MTVLLALLSSALWGVADFLGGTASRRLRALVVVGLSQGAALLVLVPLVLVAGERPASVWAGVGAGALGVVGLGAFYTALARGTMGVVAPIAALGAVLPVVAGLVQGEQPSGLQLAGIAVAVVGVVLASGPELSGGASPLPLVLAGIAAVGFGMVAVLLAEGSEGGGAGAVLVVLVVMRCTSVLLLAALWAAARVPLAAGRGDARALVAVGLFDVGANACFAVAAQSGLLSVVGVLASLYPVVTVLLARQLHAERLAPVQVVGVGGALLGVALLASG